MLKVRKLNHRPWPVTVILQACIEATGEVQGVEQTFVAHFKPFDQDALEAARAKAKEAFPVPRKVPAAGEVDSKAGVDDEDAVPTPIVLKRNAVFFAELLCGWGKEVVDENDQPIPFSPEALAALVTGPDGLPISAAINSALLQIQYGLAPQKNSKTSPSPGPNAGGGEAPMSSPTT